MCVSRASICASSCVSRGCIHVCLLCLSWRVPLRRAFVRVCMHMRISLSDRYQRETQRQRQERPTPRDKRDRHQETRETDTKRQETDTRRQERPTPRDKRDRYQETRETDTKRPIPGETQRARGTATSCAAAIHPTSSRQPSIQPIHPSPVCISPRQSWLTDAPLRVTLTDAPLRVTLTDAAGRRSHAPLPPVRLLLAPGGLGSWMID